MRLFIVLGILVSAYLYFMMQTTNIVLDQAKQLNNTYQYVANNSDKIAAGQ